jgi:hypothetical protein
MLWGRLVQEPEVWFAEHPTGGPYTLDFFCPSARLAVEIDGPSHWAPGMAEKEFVRDAWHQARGIVTKRFSADEVERDLDWVLSEIRVLLVADAPQLEIPAPPVLPLESVAVPAPPVSAGSWGNQLRACIDVLPTSEWPRWSLHRVRLLGSSGASNELTARGRT